MKTFLISLFLIFTTSAYAFDPASITFSITSSAKTSTPNLRIARVSSTVATEDRTRIPLQGMPVPGLIANYYLTKSTTYTFSSLDKVIEIQADQDTKMYIGSDLTNYILIYASTPRVFTVK